MLFFSFLNYLYFLLKLLRKTIIIIILNIFAIKANYIIDKNNT